MDTSTKSSTSKTAKAAYKQMQRHLAKAKQHLCEAALLAVANDEIFSEEERRLVTGLNRVSDTVIEHFSDQ